MTKKTISVVDVVRKGNDLLSEVANSPLDRDHPTSVGMRRGVMRMLEFVLFETDNYLGFEYIQCEDGQQTRDDTLRRYRLVAFGPLEDHSQTPTAEVKERLEYLRGEIESESISMGEILELQGLADQIESGDVVLLEWAGVPEFSEEEPEPEQEPAERVFELGDGDSLIAHVTDEGVILDAYRADADGTQTLLGTKGMTAEEWFGFVAGR